MKEGYFKAKTESGRIVTIRVTREEKEVVTRGGVQRIEGLGELYCLEYNSPVNPDENDATHTHFTLVFPPFELTRLEDSPFPDI